jgi:EmrB/QacA subfamily drug resistance transporter
MDARANDASASFRWWQVLRGVEPPPAPFFARLPSHPWLIVGVCCIGSFMGQLDGSIVQLALPVLTVTFDASVNDVRWVAIAYPLFFAAFLPVFGRVCEMYGRKLLYLLGYAVFTVASLLSGFAPSLGWLIAFRVLQGIGGAMLGANSMAILVLSTDAERRPHAIGLYTAAQAIGISLGPLISGLLLHVLNWQWVFWVTVPFGLAATLLGWLVLPRTAKLEQDKSFDWPGAFLVVPSLVLAILALNQVSVWPLASPAMILCLVVAVVLLALFVRQQRRSACPLIDMALFGNRAFAAGAIGVALGYALLYGMLFLMSFALLTGFQDDSRIAGLKLAIIPIAIGLVASLSIVLSKRWGARMVGIAGLAFVVASLLSLTLIALSPIGSLATGLSALAVFGVGLGLFMVPNNHATIEAAPPHLAGPAAAQINLLRVIGTCIGVSAASSMMSWQMELAGHKSWAVPVTGHPIISAVEGSLIMLVLFAVIAAATLLIRPNRKAA